MGAIRHSLHLTRFTRCFHLAVLSPGQHPWPATDATALLDLLPHCADIALAPRHRDKPWRGGVECSCTLGSAGSPRSSFTPDRGRCGWHRTDVVLDHLGCTCLRCDIRFCTRGHLNGVICDFHRRHRTMVALPDHGGRMDRSFRRFPTSSDSWSL